MKIPKSVSCETETPWSVGANFTNYLKINQAVGITGLIEFNEQTGSREVENFSIVDKFKQTVDLVRIKIPFN